MHRLAGMGGAGQRHHLAVEAEARDTAVDDQREELEWLGGRTPVGDEFGIAGATDQATVRGNHRDRHLMRRLDHRATRVYHFEICHPSPR